MTRGQRVAIVLLAVVPFGLVVAAAWAAYEAWQMRDRGKGHRHRWDFR